MASESRLAARRRPSAPPDGPLTGTRRVIGEKALEPLVLLVDDVQETREMYAEYLEHAGFRVAHAADGDHALFKMITALPDLVVMDLAMPLLDGWEATHQIKTSFKTKHIPVIVLTGDATQVSQQRAHDAGADAVLLKPCTPDVLAVTIRGLLGT